MGLFRDFISGTIPLNMDSATIYSVTKFYFNNLLNGVVPLWDPFVLLGTPFYAITLCNLFNPAVLLVPLLKWVGFNYYQAFITYMLCYFFTGAIGFYCLAKILFKDKALAYVAFLLLLFSGIGASMFNQLTIVELFVPAVWFFVFLLKFADGFKKSDFLGLTFSAMTVTIAYLPFYFATLLLCFSVLIFVIFFNESKRFVSGLLQFLNLHKGLVAVCILGQCIALTPLVVYKMMDDGRDVVSPGRHCNYAELVDCYDRTLNEKGGMSYKESSQGGGLAERVDLRGLISHLDKASYGIDQFFYLPVIVFVLLILSMFALVNRQQCLLAFLAVFLTMVGMGEATPVHRFLYEHLFYFRYFRNLFFFESFIIPLVILFAVGQLKALMSLELIRFSQKKAWLFWVVLVHGGILFYLSQTDGIGFCSYLTILGSCILFGAAFMIRNSKQRLLYLGMLILIVLQPIEVLSQYSKNAKSFQCTMPHEHVRPQFSWTRPVEEVKSDCKIFKFVHYESFYDSMAMKDSRGYIGYPVSVTRGAFLLSQWVDEKTILQYTSQKFWLYDHMYSFNEHALEIRTVGESLKSQWNAVYTNAGEEAPPAIFTAQDGGENPALILDPSQATVEHFDVNRLKISMEVSSRKFLVYTDGFTKHWKVLVNGKREKLYRAQAAFKGVWIPAGKSTVEFRYEPPGGGWIYLLVTMCFVCFLCLELYSFYRDDNWPWRLKV
jgi:hypothetical protein